MKELGSLRVLFLGENGKSIIGTIMKISLCGVVVEPQHNSRVPEMGETGNIIVTAGNGKKKSVMMAWGQIGEHSDDYLEFYFQHVDENSQVVLKDILAQQRTDAQSAAA